MTDMDREAELAARFEQLEARLVELEEQARDAEARARDWEKRARGRREDESLESMMTGLLPPDVRGHLRAARKEQLLAAKAMLDHWIDRIDRKPGDRRRRETIPLDES